MGGSHRMLPSGRRRHSQPRLQSANQMVGRRSMRLLVQQHLFFTTAFKCIMALHTAVGVAGGGSRRRAIGAHDTCGTDVAAAVHTGVRGGGAVGPVWRAVGPAWRPVAALLAALGACSHGTEPTSCITTLKPGAIGRGGWHKVCSCKRRVWAPMTLGQRASAGVESPTCRVAIQWPAGVLGGHAGLLLLLRLAPLNGLTHVLRLAQELRIHHNDDPAATACSDITLLSRLIWRAHPCSAPAESQHKRKRSS